MTPPFMGPSINPATSDEELTFPCSSSQQRCWFIDAMNPGTSALNVALRWELKGSVNSATVEKAFRTIVQRHEVLRMRIVETDGAPLQVMAPALDLKLSEIDLTMIPASQRLDEALRLGKLEAHKPFDLAELPLIRITLLRLGNDRAFLLLTIHQIAFDGFSIRLISREFGTIAAAIEANRPHGLPDLVLQYGDFALWQKAYLASSQFEREKNYWRKQLAGAPYFEVSGDRKRQAQPTYSGEILARFLSDTFTEAMVQKVKLHKLTLFSFGCAVIAGMLHHYTGAEDISLGTQIAGRDDPDLEPLIGVFINNLVLRIDVSGDPTFAGLLSRVNLTVKDALVHRRMPFHTLVEVLKPPRDPRRMPLISVNFTVLQDVMDDARYGSFDLIGHPSLSAGSLYDLNFFMVHWPATGWRIALEYNTDLFDRATGEKLLALWHDLFRLALGEADFKLSELSLPGLHEGASDDQGSGVLIEGALVRHPAVAEAAVITQRSNGATSHRAFAVLRPDYAGTLDGVPAMLAAHLREALPNIGRVAVSLLMALPCDPDGKVDRAALAAWPVPVIQPEPETKPLALRSHLEPLSGNAEIEALLIGVWTEIFEVSHVTPTSNFFDLGGHSLLALRMLSRVQRVCGRKVNVSDLFNAPTVREFAGCLTGSTPKQASTDSDIAQSQDSEHDRPLGDLLEPPGPDDWRMIEVHPAGSDTSIFGINSISDLFSFSGKLGGHRGLYSVQLFEPGRPHCFGAVTLPGIASAYVEVIRRAQPRGPYILFGLCVHGVLAYEIAQQLKQAGEDVELLAFTSAWHPTYFRRLSLANQWIIRLSHLRNNFGLVLAGQKSIAAFLANYSIVQRSGLLSLAVRLGLIDAVPPRTGSEQNDDALLALMAARDTYVPQPYDGRVMQFVGADAPRGRGFDPTLGWTGTINGPITVVDESQSAPKKKQRVRG